jgi:hypothetical protein
MPRRRISSDLKRDIVAFAGGGLAALIRLAVILRALNGSAAFAHWSASYSLCWSED